MNSPLIFPEYSEEKAMAKGALDAIALLKADHREGAPA
jgi:hypothetical protein